MFSKKYKRKSGNIMDSDVGLFLGVCFTVLTMFLLPLYIATALPSGKLFERAGEKQ